MNDGPYKTVWDTALELSRRVSSLEHVIVMARREFRKGGDPTDSRAWLFRVEIDEDQYPGELE